MELTDVEVSTIIKESAALRGARRYQEAIDKIESKILDFPKELRFNGYYECLSAAEEGQLQEVALHYAKLLRLTDPDLPKLKKYFPQPY